MTVITGYIVVCVFTQFGGGDAPDVNKKIAEGWQPYGSISCQSSICYQPMVKYKTVSDESRAGAKRKKIVHPAEIVSNGGEDWEWK